MVQSPSSSNARITLVDALRGFALAGIVIVHMIENYLGGAVPEGAISVANQGILDQVVTVFTWLFLRGKFFALFSFLFGLSFYLQMDSAKRRDQPFARIFAWRLLLLLGIGYAHQLFYRDDILTIYALIGMLLIPFYKIRSGWILGLAALMFLGLPRFLLFASGKGDGLFLENLTDPENPINNAYFKTLTSGSLLEVFRSNGWSGQLVKMEFQFGIFSRGYLTFAFFLLGLYMGRLRYFRTYLKFIKQTRRALWISISVFVLSLILTAFAFIQLGAEPDFNSLWAMFGLTAMDIGNLAMTIIILSGFVLLYRKPTVEHTLNRLAPYGRMALTNYVAQSLFGTFIFYGWGLGLFGSLRNIYVFLISLTIIWVQVQVSKLWLSRYYYGPLEWLWRSLTHFKKYPLKKE